MRFLALTSVLALGCLRQNPGHDPTEPFSGAVDLGKADEVHGDLAGVTAADLSVTPDLSDPGDLAGADLKKAPPELSDLSLPTVNDLATASSADLSTPSDLAQPLDFTVAGDLAKSAPVASCPPEILTAPSSTVTLSGGGVDPDGGPVTFQWTVLSAPAGSSSTPATPSSAGTSFFTDVAGSYTLRLTVSDDEGGSTNCTTKVRAETLLVQLTWSTAHGDADLHLAQANNVWYSNSACWWNHHPASWSPAGIDGDANLDLDDADGFGPESISVRNPSPAVYEIGVAYWCSKSGGIEGGAATATVKVFCNGTLAATYGGISLDRTGRFVDVASVTMPGCIGQSVMSATFTALVQPQTVIAPYHCDIDCVGNSDCTPGEICSGGVCDLD